MIYLKYDNTGEKTILSKVIISEEIEGALDSWDKQVLSIGLSIWQFFFRSECENRLGTPSGPSSNYVIFSQDKIFSLEIRQITYVEHRFDHFLTYSHVFRGEIPADSQRGSRVERKKNVIFQPHLRESRRFGGRTSSKYEMVQ